MMVHAYDFKSDRCNSKLESQASPFSSRFPNGMHDVNKMINAENACITCTSKVIALRVLYTCRVKLKLKDAKTMLHTGRS